MIAAAVVTAAERLVVAVVSVVAEVIAALLVVAVERAELLDSAMSPRTRGRAGDAPCRR